MKTGLVFLIMIVMMGITQLALGEVSESEAQARIALRLIEKEAYLEALFGPESIMNECEGSLEDCHLPGPNLEEILPQKSESERLYCELVR